MSYLHNDIKAFSEAIDIAAYGNVMISQTAELDYYMTLTAKELYGRCPYLVLKGAAALAKCYRVIGRFSGRLEFIVIRDITENERIHIADAVRAAVELIGLDISYINDGGEAGFISGGSDIIKCRLAYKSICGTVFSETESFELCIELPMHSSYTETAVMPMECRVLDTIRTEAPEYTEKYGAEVFDINVRDMDIILAEKIFDICDNYLTGSIRKNSADIYDVYMLLQLVDTEDSFSKAVETVRREREGSALHPSAAQDMDIEELLYRIVKEEVYKQDYNDLTSRLLETPVSYDDAASAVYTAADSKVFSVG